MKQKNNNHDGCRNMTMTPAQLQENGGRTNHEVTHNDQRDL
jgi:hypothetical protein